MQLSYCNGGRETINRFRRLYQQRDMQLVMASFKLPNAVLTDYGRTAVRGFCDPPDPRDRIRFWDRLLALHRDVPDDTLPCAYLSEMDQGLYGGLLGGNVLFLSDPDTGWISSMVEPILSDLADLPRHHPDFQGDWANRYRQQLDVFRNGAADNFGISHLIMIDGLNFVFELIGAGRTYEELLDHPDQVRAAMHLAETLNRRVQDMFFNAIPLLDGGTCSLGAGWLPGRVVSESVDPFHMTSVDYFEAWGRATIERIFAAYDGGITHLHGNGRHLLEAVATVRGLKAIAMGDDTGYPPAFPLLPEWRQRIGNVPLIVQANYEDFVTALDRRTLTGGVYYQVNGAPDLQAVRRCMEQIRSMRSDRPGVS